MSARDEILGNIRLRGRARTSRPDAYRPPPAPADLVAAFIEKARAVDTDIRVLEREDEIPAAVAELLRARNLAARIHLPPQSDLADIDWRLDVARTPPGPDDAAVTRAPFAIAETGTLVQPSRAASPASWHFRPGFEIAILRARDIVAHFEDVKLGALPATVNLITGPSRTGDIEQTLELGAHGPKALAVLVIR
jgi:L-lactate dehydrogenase complex protein LldG